MENKNNIDWNVNLNYITKDDLKTIYGFIPDADQTTTDNTKTDFTIMAIAISSERINTITGNQIEVIGFKNLNETQQQLVKRATARMTIYYLTDGMAFIRSSVSISGNGLSSSISPPSEPDYVLMEVYNLLQQANLHTPRKAINNSISCNTDNFNTPNIFDESDNRVITWDSGNKTFLRKEGITAGVGIKIDDISDTIPKLKIHVDSNIDSLWEVDKDNPNFIKSKDNKGIDANGRRLIDVGTPTFLSDATNKEYVDKKQDKLTAGENIKIDEKTNTISATGGSSVDENRIFNNKDDKNSTTRLVNEVIKTNVGGKTLIYRNEPVVTDDLDIPNKKYIDDKIDKKQDKENWVVIGKKVDNRTWDNFNIDLNKTYRVFITWHRNAPEQNGYPLMLLFKSAKAVGTGTWTLLIGKIDNKDASLILNADYTKSTNKWSLFIKCEIDGGAIFSFEELKENTYQITSNTLNITSPSVINIDKPIKINSKSLETNEIEENNWDIELKNNPPTPTPNIPQWKEVGTREKNKLDNWQITYDFQENKHYRVYYSWNIYNPVYTIQEFIITNKKIAGVQIQTFNDSANIVILSVQHAKWITIYTGKGKLKGNVWKLEELQE
ncbi:hypothetical protein [Spiroplasma endosymbiont of Dasysyrphus albostriatus]|uniref:hypothetical protein n=1 Tax=Spiroplasma endosymbiont of Dasysyrphus albostriatus TaxID=3066299 RepID=UPI0030CC8583